MGTEGNTALKAIAILGVVAFLFLALLSAGLRSSLRPNEAERVQIVAGHSPFDGNRALKHVQNLVEIGPRAPGSPAAASARAYITAELRSEGIQYREEPFTYATPAGERTGMNLMATISGKRPGAIAVVASLDSVELPDSPAAGANESSASAWLLELARTVGRDRFGRALHLVWVDACAPQSPGDTGTHGFAALAGTLVSTSTDERPAVIIEIEHPGDCYLNFSLGHAQDAAWLRQIVRETAQRFNYIGHFAAPFPAKRAHALAVFKANGIATITVEDAVYGGSPVQHQQLFRTPLDSIEHVCPESLKAAGDVLYHALQAIDGYLDQLGSGAT